MTESSLTGGVMVDTRESTLVARAQVGDRDAFEALVIPRLDRLLRLAMSILSNDADASDAVQEAVCGLGGRFPGCVSRTGSRPGCGASPSTDAGAPFNPVTARPSGRSRQPTRSPATTPPRGTDRSEKPVRSRRHRARIPPA